jgi:hypothetical protein
MTTKLASQPDDMRLKAGPLQEDGLVMKQSARRGVNQGIRQHSVPGKPRYQETSPCDSDASMKSHRSGSFPIALTSHLFPKPVQKQSVRTQVARSFVLSVIFEFLRQDEILSFQALSHYFYKVQVPRCLNRIQIVLKKRRLHLLNQDYVLLFDFNKLEKSKLKIKE